MALAVGQHLGNYIGEFVEYDANNSSGIWRSYMCIKVLLDVRLPLKKEKKVKKPDGEWKTVHFKYERLGVFYFFCGRIGHVEQFCTELFEGDEDDGVRLWGPELRVEPRRGGGGTGGNKWLRDGGRANPRANGSVAFSGSNQARDPANNQGAESEGGSKSHEFSKIWYIPCKCFAIFGATCHY